MTKSKKLAHPIEIFQLKYLTVFASFHIKTFVYGVTAKVIRSNQFLIEFVPVSKIC